MNAKPSHCPICHAPMKGKILVCLDCWMTVNPVDRFVFRAAYQRTPQNVKAWQAIAEKILRALAVARLSENRSECS